MNMLGMGDKMKKKLKRQLVCLNVKFVILKQNAILTFMITLSSAMKKMVMMELKIKNKPLVEVHVIPILNGGLQDLVLLYFIL